jgi:FkbM family methyltransferase
LLTYHALPSSNLSGYYSQLGQDLLVTKFFEGAEIGTKRFVDIGAHDGINFSNTYYLEKKRGWEGVCIEPNPAVYAQLNINRKSHNLNCVISNYEGVVEFLQIDGYSEMLSGVFSNYQKKHKKRIKNEIKSKKQHFKKIDIKSIKMKTVFRELKLNYVDFMSIDTEGSEIEILQSIDFTATKFRLIIVENNYRDTKIKKILNLNGYYCALKIEHDEVYCEMKDIQKLIKIANKFFDKKSFLRKIFTHLIVRIR